jgi:hypothetical protein
MKLFTVGLDHRIGNEPGRLLPRLGAASNAFVP